MHVPWCLICAIIEVNVAHILRLSRAPLRRGDEAAKGTPDQSPLKKVLLWNGYFGAANWDLHDLGKAPFAACGQPRCSVVACGQVGDAHCVEEARAADALLVHGRDPVPQAPAGSPSRRHVFYLEESPEHLNPFNAMEASRRVGGFHWTATYRHDADIRVP